MGLELRPSKTTITHTLHQHEGRVGFDFLGFTVRQFPVGRTHSGRNRHGELLGFKTLIRPSAASQQRHLADIKDFLRRNRQLPQRALIDQLSGKIRGWANFHSRQVSARVFRKIDHLVYCKLKRWAERRHPDKSRTWVYRHYWHPREDRTAVFAPPTGRELAAHASTSIQQYRKVGADASPYNGDLVYWASRLGHHPELSSSKALLLKRQQGRCAWCGMVFTNLDELIESDHVLPRSLGGRDQEVNRQLLHGHCHEAKSAIDGSSRRRSSEVPVSRANKKLRIGQ
jgi:RNA-directed DNA polymerase